MPKIYVPIFWLEHSKSEDHNKKFPQKSKKSYFYLLFNVRYPRQFLKNLMSRFTENFKNVDFGPQNAIFYPILGIIRIFLQNPKRLFLLNEKSKRFA